MTKLDQSNYLAERLKELRRCQKQARVNLQAAQMLHRERPRDRERKALLVRSIANLELTNAYLDALQMTGPASLFNPTNLRAPTTH